GDGWRIACGVDVFVCVALARFVFRSRSAVTAVVLFAVATDAITLVLVSHPPFATRHGAGLILIVLAIAVSALLRQFSVRSMWAYLLIAGPLAWLGCYGSGLHPALALLPVVPFFPRAPRQLVDFDDFRHAHARVAHFESVFAYPLQAVAF